MSKLSIILLVILIIMIGVLVALYFIGKRLEKQQAEQRRLLEEQRQKQRKQPGNHPFLRQNYSSTIIFPYRAAIWPAASWGSITVTRVP